MRHTRAHAGKGDADRLEASDAGRNAGVATYDARLVGRDEAAHHAQALRARAEAGRAGELAVSLRIRNITDLPAAMRESIRGRLSTTKAPKLGPAARDLRLEELRVQRDSLVLLLLEQLSHANLACLFAREHQFHPQRKWRLDLYSAGHKLAIEVHGGIWSGGRHTNPAGFIKDREKMNAATEFGILVLEYWPEAIRDGSALKQIERVLACR